MHTLICGSMAYDTIMVFKDQFKNHILPDQIHILNVAFLVPEMRREYGGCAGNIAYNLQMLGGNPLIMATVGDDFAPYASRLDKLGLGANAYPPCAESFHRPGLHHHRPRRQPDHRVPSRRDESVAPEQRRLGERSLAGHRRAGRPREGMLQHAVEFADLGIPFVFDPGQGMPMFSGAELLTFIEQATYVTVNDYEARMLQDKTGKTLNEIAQRVKALIVTLGGEGSMIYAGGKADRHPHAQA